MSAVLNALEAPPTSRLPRPAPTVSEFSFGGTDVERVRRLMFRRAGIRLGVGKQVLVYSRLSQRLRETEHHSFSDYLHWLEFASGAAAAGEWHEFVSCLTTHPAAFFREPPHFDALAAALRQRAGEALRIWCQAAATGEEAYSVAIVCAETPDGGAGVQIVASDIDTRVLASARRGVYPADAGGLSAERLDAHFLRGKGLHSGFIRVKPELAQRVGFRPIDADASVAGRFDIVFCRNATLPADASAQRRVLEGIHAAMNPQGLLFAGFAESLIGDAAALFRHRGHGVCERG